MNEHIFDPEHAERLEDESRFDDLPREDILEMIDDGDVVLDLGCGTGFYTDVMADKAGKVYALDFSGDMLDYYREKGVPENVELINSEARNTGLEDDSIDVIFSITTLHEFSEDAFDEMARVVAEDGTIFVHDWSARSGSSRGPPAEHLYTAEVSERFGQRGFKVDSEEKGDFFRVTAR